MLVVDQIINGLAIGNIYALIALGFTLIFGVANLINFAHGSVFMIGAYIGWRPGRLSRLAFPGAAAGRHARHAPRSACSSSASALRPLAGAPPIAPLLSTIAVAIIIDRAAELIFTPETQLFPALLPLRRHPARRRHHHHPRPDRRRRRARCAPASSTSSCGSIASAGRSAPPPRTASPPPRWASTSTASTALTFGIGSALGGVAGVLVGQYFASISPAMGFQFGLKGFVAAIIGGLGHLPGAIVGGLLLGVAESLGVTWLSTDYRNLIAFVLLIVVLLVRPGGLLRRGHGLSGQHRHRRLLLDRPAARHPSMADRARRRRGAGAAAGGDQHLRPAGVGDRLHLRHPGRQSQPRRGLRRPISLGHAALYGIGAYAVGLLMLNAGLPFWVALPLAAIITAVIGVALTAPALSLSGHYVAIATLGLGEIVNLLLLNLIDVTRGPLGLRGIPGVELFGYPLQGPRDYYWLALVGLAVTTALAVLIWPLAPRPHAALDPRGRDRRRRAGRPAQPLQELGLRRRRRAGRAGRRPVRHADDQPLPQQLRHRRVRS